MFFSTFFKNWSFRYYIITFYISINIIQVTSNCFIKRNICIDFIIDEVNTIKLYLFILIFLKSIFAHITTIAANIAIIKVIIFALSDAINIKPIIIGNTWYNIVNGWRTEIFSLAKAILLRGYVIYIQIVEIIHRDILNNVIFSLGILYLIPINQIEKIDNKIKAWETLEIKVCQLFHIILFSSTFLVNTIQVAPKKDCIIQIIHIFFI